MNKKWMIISVILFVVIVIGIILIDYNAPIKIDSNFGVDNWTEINKTLQEYYNKLCYTNGDFAKDFDSCTGLVMSPESKLISIKSGETGAFNIVFKNTYNETGNYSYEVKTSNYSNCNYTLESIDSWIVVGRAEGSILLGVGEVDARRIFIKIPDEVSPCRIYFNVLLKRFDVPVASDSMEVIIK